MALSYEQRVARMKTVVDVGDQLQKAINAAKKLKREVNNAQDFSQKIEAHRNLKEAESIVRKLRSNLFDLEEQISLRIQQKAQAKTEAEARIEEAAIKHFGGSTQSERLFAF
jgi:phage shock protein A